MRICESCGKKVHDGKHRMVVLDRAQAALCGECGRIEYEGPDGMKRTGLVLAVTMPLRRNQKGRNLTFHADHGLRAGDTIRSATFHALPRNPAVWPTEYCVLDVRPIEVLEIVEGPEPGGKDSKKKPRRRRRRVGWSVHACTA